MPEFSSLNGYTVKDTTARNIAKGRNQAVAFSDYATMIAELNVMEKDQYKTGQNIYIGIVGVPDLWVYSVESVVHNFSYVSDDDVVEKLTANTTIQAGYYKLAMLEGQKVDLTTVNEQLTKHTEDITELNKNLESHLHINSSELQAVSLATALRYLCEGSEYGSYSGRFKCKEGWYTIHCFNAGDGGFNSGYVASINSDDAYIFRVKAGADAVLKKLGAEPTYLGSITCNATNDTFDVAAVDKNYANYTEDNFMIVAESHYDQIIIINGTGSGAALRNGTYKITKTYDATTGTLTIKNGYYLIKVSGDYDVQLKITLGVYVVGGENKSSGGESDVTVPSAEGVEF